MQFELKAFYQAQAQRWKAQAVEPYPTDAEKQAARLYPERVGEAGRVGALQQALQRLPAEERAAIETRLRKVPQHMTPELNALLGQKKSVLAIRNFLSGEFEPLPVADLLETLRAQEKLGLLKITERPGEPKPLPPAKKPAKPARNVRRPQPRAESVWSPYCLTESPTMGEESARLDVLLSFPYHCNVMTITDALNRRSPWLLLVFSLPTGKASQRVEVWRRLRRFGAVSLGNSGYLLPNIPGNRERFEWLATSIRNYRGEASVVQVQSIDNLSTTQLVRRFAEARARDYQELVRQLQKVVSAPSPKRSQVRLSRLRQRFQEVVAIDFFQSPLRGRVEQLLETAQSAGPSSSHADVRKFSRKDYQGRVWVTRPRPGVDRVTSAWLIRRFIDPKARFAFAREGGVPRGAVPFDMFQGGFGHRGEDCTFETLQKQFRIRDGKVSVLAQIVHDADLGDGEFGRKEGFGIDEVLKGWDKLGLSDREILSRGLQLAEGLYHSLP